MQGKPPRRLFPFGGLSKKTSKSACHCSIILPARAGESSAGRQAGRRLGPCCGRAAECWPCCALELLPVRASRPGECGCDGVGWGMGRPLGRAVSTPSAHSSSGDLCFLSGLSLLLEIELAMTMPVWEFPQDGPGLVSKITPFKACRDF